MFIHRIKCATIPVQKARCCAASRLTCCDTVQSADHRTENDFQNRIRAQPCCLLTRAEKASARLSCVRAVVECRGVDHVTHAGMLVCEVVIHVPERCSGLRIVADLEELDSDLIHGCVQCVELLGHPDDFIFWLVVGCTIGDDDEIERPQNSLVASLLDPLRVELQVYVEDGSHTHGRGGAAAGRDTLEEVLHVLGLLDAAVACARGSLERIALVRGLVVEKVDVDTVFIVLGADGDYGFEDGAGLVPVAAIHGAGVVDEEDGVKRGQESIRVVLG